MIRLLDGPAQGTYAARRGPLYLRAVTVVEQDGGGSDVLDELDDTPHPDERVSVYRRSTPLSHVHLRMGGRSRAGSGFYAMADYRHVADVDGEMLRDTEMWRVWVRAQPDGADT